MAQLIGSDPYEIIFTSGSTEAINLAIKGVAESYEEKGNHIVTVETEHKAVLDVCKYLETKGFEVTYLPVDSDGVINLDTIKKALRPNTILVSVMYVNNETGVIQPIEEIARIVHENGSIFMSDTTQAIGKIPINVSASEIDILTFSAHKYYGPKGIGALYIRRKGKSKIKISPMMHGGGHESGYRSGTLNVPGIVGFGKASEIALQEIVIDSKKIKILRDYLENELIKIKNTNINGSISQRLYNVSNICFKGIDADAIMTGIKNICVSTGSACTSALTEPSHVLKAMGKSDDDAYSSLRFSLGKYNTIEEIRKVIEEVRKTVENMRKLTSNI